MLSVAALCCRCGITCVPSSFPGNYKPFCPYGYCANSFNGCYRCNSMAWCKGSPEGCPSPPKIVCNHMSDTFKPDWNNTDASASPVACANWAINSDWGALSNGETLDVACTKSFGEENCAQTCCFKLMSPQCIDKEDKYIDAWADNSPAACAQWAINAKWGALKGGESLETACAKEWAQENCAKTCCERLA